MARRVLLLVVTALTDGGRAQVMWGVDAETLMWPRFFVVNMTLFISAVYHAHEQPFRRPLMNRLETLGLLALTLLFNGEVVVMGLENRTLRRILSFAMSVVEAVAVLVFAFYAVVAPKFGLDFGILHIFRVHRINVQCWYVRSTIEH